MMQYLGFLIPVLLAYFFGDIWQGIVLGSMCWFVVGAIKKSTERQQREDWEARLAQVEAELAALKQQLPQAVRDGVLAEAKPRPAPSLRPSETAAPAQNSVMAQVAQPAQKTFQTASPAAEITEHDKPAVVLAKKDVAEPANAQPTTSFQPKAAIKPSSPVSTEISAEKTAAIEIPDAPETPEQPAKEHPIQAWFMRGNPLLKTGIVVLFLGLAFLLRLASEYIYIPIGARYAAVGAAGLVATLAGWKLQKRKRDYGLILQGFGVAVMYLTSLAALKLHPLLPAPAVFAVMVALVVLMAALAVRQNALVLAQVALIGGMAAPLLVSDGSGRYLILFSYLALLNTGVAGIAWFKAWRSLNLTGFIGTFAIGAFWGAQAYTPQHFATTEPFLIYHWLLYTLIACLFARKVLQEKRHGQTAESAADNASLEHIFKSITTHRTHINVLDSALLFGTAFLAYGLQYRMVATWENAAAWSALGFAAVYALFALRFARMGTDMRVMKQAFTLLAFLFATLAVPLAFDQQWTAAAWTLEAALVYTFGIRQQQPAARLGAIGVYILAALTQLSTYRAGAETILSGPLLGTLLVAAGGGWMYFQHLKRPNPAAAWENNAQKAVLTLALLHASLLPLLIWGKTGSMIAFAVLTAACSHIQRKHPQIILTAFTLLYGAYVLAVSTALIQDEHSASAPWLILCALLLGTAAYGLHKPKYQATHSSLRDAHSLGGWAMMAVSLWLGWHGLSEGMSLLDYDLWMSMRWIPVILFAPFAFTARKLDWRQAKTASLAFGIIFGLYTLSDFLFHLHQPLSDGLLLLVGTALYVYILNMQTLNPSINAIYQRIGLLIFGACWTWLVSSSVFLHFNGVWAQLSWLAVPLAAWLYFQSSKAIGLVKRYPDIYRHFGSQICALYAAGWLLWVNFSAPHAPAPLPYLPVINPLELSIIALIWQYLLQPYTWVPQEWSAEAKRQILAAPVLLAFISLSAGVMRAWHFFDHVAWDFATLIASFGLQASLSIVWSAAAITLMVNGHQKGRRIRWFTGAALMGLVVAKLFLVELGNSGGIARIVSFIGVGLLLLLVGWFAPVPPKDETDPQS